MDLNAFGEKVRDKVLWCSMAAAGAIWCAWIELKNATDNLKDKDNDQMD